MHSPIPRARSADPERRKRKSQEPREAKAWRARGARVDANAPKSPSVSNYMYGVGSKDTSCNAIPQLVEWAKFFASMNVHDEYQKSRGLGHLYGHRHRLYRQSRHRTDHHTASGEHSTASHQLSHAPSRQRLKLKRHAPLIRRSRWRDVEHPW